MGTGRNRYLTWVASAVAVGLLGSALAAPVAVAAPEDPYVNTALPAITGVAKVGVTLTASPGSWTPAPETFSYQWMRDGADVSGAVTASYALAAADLNHAISVEVTASGKEQTPGSATSAKTAKVVAGTLKAARPSVSGELAVGSTIKAAASGWTTGTTFTRQWYADGKAIAKATGESFRLGSSQAGKRISVKVTGSKAGYSSVSVASAQTAKVMKASTPKISGSAKNGSKLKVKTGSWTSKVKKSYQWLRNGAAIRKATKSTYKLTASDVGKKISVRVTGKRSGYATISRTSGAVSVRGKTLKSTTPAISGKLSMGSRLTAKPGKWTSGTSFSYQWNASGAPIAGATRSTFTLSYREAGKSVSVTVTGKKSGYTTLKRTSKSVRVRALTTRIDSDRAYRAGFQVMPGTYTASGDLGCYWERNSDSKFDPKKIINNGPLNHGGRVLVTIKAGEYFWSEECGTWYLDGARSEPRPASFRDGDQTVKRTVNPGRYISTDAPLCEWWRLSRVDGDYYEANTGQEGVLGWGPVHRGQTIVDIKASDPYFVSASCGTWTPLPETPAFRTELPDGDYAIGVHVQPGIWVTNDATDSCYFEDGKDFTRGAGTFDAWEGLSTTIRVEFLAGDARFSTSGCGTWVREEVQPQARTTSGPDRTGGYERASVTARHRQVELAGSSR